jgi:hypothetical protein
MDRLPSDAPFSECLWMTGRCFGVFEIAFDIGLVIRAFLETL